MTTTKRMKKRKKSTKYQKLKVESHMGDGKLCVALARITPL
jgi:hypothetical protein